MNKAMKKNKRQTVHYAWKIMAACIMIKLGSSGAIHAAMSNFVAPIVEELGCQVSELTMFTSIQEFSPFHACLFHFLQDQQ